MSFDLNRRLTERMPPLPGAGEIDSVTSGLKGIHDAVDRATLRVKELEATINVYAIEKEQMEAVLRSLPIAVLVTESGSEDAPPDARSPIERRRASISRRSSPRSPAAIGAGAEAGTGAVTRTS